MLIAVLSISVFLVIKSVCELIGGEEFKELTRATYLGVINNGPSRKGKG